MKLKPRVKISSPASISDSVCYPCYPVASGQAYDWKRTVRGMAVLAAVYCIIVYLIPRPVSVKPEGWRVTAIFFSTILGLIIQPIPGGAVVLLGVTLAAGARGPVVAHAQYDGVRHIVLRAHFLTPCRLILPPLPSLVGTPRKLT